MGKKAIHLGDSTQILFGIKGKRCIDNENFKAILNEHFVSPEDTDKIKNASKVEESCYG
jgi:hypothetical protein